MFPSHDRPTSRWYIDNIRNPMENSPEVFMATVIFRWFNLIQTGETLVKYDLLTDWDPLIADVQIRKQDQWITGAYVIKSPNGFDKLQGIIRCINNMWYKKDEILEEVYQRKNSMEKMWEYLKSKSLPVSLLRPRMAPGPALAHVNLSSASLKNIVKLKSVTTS